MYEKTPQLELTNGVKIYNDSFEYKKKRFFLPNIDRRNFFSALSALVSFYQMRLRPLIQLFITNLIAPLFMNHQHLYNFHHLITLVTGGVSLDNFSLCGLHIILLR